MTTDLRQIFQRYCELFKNARIAIAPREDGKVDPPQTSPRGKSELLGRKKKKRQESSEIKTNKGEKT